MSTDTPSQPEEWAAERAAFETYMDETHFAYWRTTAFGREAWRMWKAAVLAASPQPTAAQPLKDAQAVAELVEALKHAKLGLSAQESLNHYGRKALRVVEAALSRAPGAGMLNVRAKPAPTAGADVGK